MKKILKNYLCVLLSASMLFSGSIISYADEMEIKENNVESGSAVDVVTVNSEEIIKATASNSLWDYDVTTEGVYVTKYLGNDENVTIPETIDGLPVVQIGHYTSYSGSHNNVFENTLVKTVVVPSTVKTIYFEAFAGSKTLQSIILPEGLKKIDECAFKNCTSLETITIPSTVIEYGEQAFMNCTYLANVEINSGADISESMFENCESLENLKFNKSINTIGVKSFCSCKSLKNIDFIEGLKGIESWAFDGCSIKSLKMPSTLKKIEMYAFMNNSYLTDVTFNDGITFVGDGAFQDCTSLTSVNFSDSIETIGYGAFNDCISLNKVVMGKGLISVGSYAFEGCSSLTNVKLNEGLQLIGNCAFEGCKSLESVIIPSTVISISDYAFYKNVSGINFNSPCGIKRVIFLGAQPASFGKSVFPNDAVIYYAEGNGWTEGTYNGYKCYPYPDVNEEIKIDDCDRTGFILNISGTDIAYSRATIEVWSNANGKDDVEVIETAISYDSNNHTSYIEPLNITTSNHNNETGTYSIALYYGIGSDKSPVVKTKTVNVPTVSNKVELNFDNITATTGGTVRVPLKITNNVGFSTFAFMVNYDSSVLTPVSATNGKLWTGNFAANTNYAQGQISINGMDITNFNKTGDFCYIDFKVNNSINYNTSTQLSVTVNELYKYDNNYNTVAVRSIVSDGNINIQNIVMGDINFDNKITSLDASQALLHASKIKTLTGTAFTAADVNKDGKITSLDATNILLAATGLKKL